MGHEIVWKLKDLDKLKRRLTLLYAGPEGAETVLQFFTDELAQYPLEWPIQDEEGRTEEWRWGRILVRYRREPSRNLVEVLEVTNTSTPWPPVEN